MLIRDLWTPKSAFTVAALSVDRFCAVSSPLGMRKYRRKDCAIYVTIFTWIAATLWHGIVIVFWSGHWSIWSNIPLNSALPSAYWSTVTAKSSVPDEAMTPEQIEELHAEFNRSYFSQNDSSEIQIPAMLTSSSPLGVPTIMACVPIFSWVYTHYSFHRLHCVLRETSISAQTWVTVHYIIRCIVCFLIPLLVMITCNIGMIRSLIRAARKSRLGKKSFIGARKRKITKFAVCVVICFIVCWLPGPW